MAEKSSIKGYEYEHGKIPDIIDFKGQYNRQLFICSQLLTFSREIFVVNRAITVFEIMSWPKADKKFWTRLQDIEGEKVKEIKKLEPADRKNLSFELELKYLFKRYQACIELGTRKGMIIVREATDEI